MKEPPTVRLVDLHPGGWNDGVVVHLVIGQHPRHGTFMTAVRAEGMPAIGMFGEGSGPIQAVKHFGDGVWALTMSNLGEISETERKELLAEGEIRINEFTLTLI